MGNPYLDEFVRAGGLLNPDDDMGTWPFGGLSTERAMALLSARWPMIRRYAHAIPTEEALAAIGALSPLVEVGAGAGYWAWMLAAHGADIVAYDQDPAASWRGTEPMWFDVRPLGAELAAERHPDRTLLLVWPPFDKPMAEEALHAYGSAGGRRLAYVGEPSEGCTAGEGFFRLLDADWRETGAMAIPQWPGLHDGLWLYERGAPEG